jgi:hypothetical protein
MTRKLPEYLLHVETISSRFYREKSGTFPSDLRIDLCSMDIRGDKFSIDQRDPCILFELENFPPISSRAVKLHETIAMKQWILY